ncbi:MAG: allophanate hydrolase [Gemmatimonadaceae bacterium]|nr:allophanate hydrolase [Gloeobacterales cyanobacterium ES-bin-141]
MLNLTITALREAYRKGLRPAEVVREIDRRVDARGDDSVWIHRIPLADLLTRAEHLEANPDLPLYGIPFALKDNIDVAGLPTTAGCPAFRYVAERTAPVVERLLAAGAILIGKTNLDQFATGLVGTRSPYGVPSCVFDERYIAGGSSSGSAVAVAAALVSFALGTDTAGSGRVPAAFNAIVGLKPSHGLLSTAGVVPACHTLDCVSVFALTCQDARQVLEVAGETPVLRGPVVPAGAPFRFGVPVAAQLEFFGDVEAAELYRLAQERLVGMGGERVEIDFAPFQAAAQLLYGGPWVAERLAAVGEFLFAHPGEIHPVVSEIISSGSRFSAVDAFRGLYRLEELKEAASHQWKQMDMLVLPTTGTTYTKAEVEAEPIKLNTNLGYYTNFVNLMDLCALALPAGLRPNGLPFGIQFIAPAFNDRSLSTLGETFLVGTADSNADPSLVRLAVVGAHLSGQPLNYQLTERHARLVRACRTADNYRLYALAGTVPPKPGLVRDPDLNGQGIEVEVWAMTGEAFGSFVAAVPEPLVIGTLVLEDGERVKGFLCEPYAIADAREITYFEGWRAYLADLSGG